MSTWYIGPLEIKQQNGLSTQTLYLRGGGEMLSKHQGGTTEFYHQNHLGSTELVTNSSGNVVSRMRYYPFGEVDGPNSTNEASVEKTFTGQQADSGMGGLMYYNGRYYDPTISRFISADPIITDKYNLQSYNRYAYVMNNPVMLNDPSGYSWLSKSLGLDKANAPDLIRDINKEYHNLQKEFVKNPTLQQAGYFATAACGPYAPACAAGYSGWLAKSAGASDEMAFKAAVVSGVSTYVSAKAQTAYYDNKIGAAKFTSISVTNGALSSAAMGGKLGDGAKMGAISAFANILYKNTSNPGNLFDSGEIEKPDVVNSGSNHIGIDIDPEASALQKYVQVSGPVSQFCFQVGPACADMARMHDSWGKNNTWYYTLGLGDTAGKVVSIIPAWYITIEATGAHTQYFRGR